MDKKYNDNLSNDDKQNNEQDHTHLLKHDPSEYVKVEIVPHCYFYVRIPDKETRDYAVKYLKEQFNKPKPQNKDQRETN